MTEQIETERESVLQGEYIQSGSSERVFSTFTKLTEFTKAFHIESGRFGIANLDGERKHILQYKSVNQ